MWRKLLFQPIEAVARGRADKDVSDRAVVGDALGISDPIGRRQIGVYFQIEIGRGRGPIDYRRVRAGELDAQHRCSGRLHGIERPEASAERIIAAGHCAAGVRLADGAAHRVNAACARAATGVYCGPVYGEVRLCVGPRYAEPEQQPCDSDNRPLAADS